MFLKGFFVLPDKDKRIFRNAWYTKLVLTNKDNFSDPDYYLMYRVGIYAKILALVLGLGNYIITLMNYYLDYFPSLSLKAKHPEMFGIIGYITEKSVIILLVGLLYYFISFLTNVNLKKYNLFRNNSLAKNKLTKNQTFWLFLFPPILTFVFLNIEGFVEFLYSFSVSFPWIYNSPILAFFLIVFLSIALMSYIQIMYIAITMQLNMVYQFFISRRKDLKS